MKAWRPWSRAGQRGTVTKVGPFWKAVSQTKASDGLWYVTRRYGFTRDHAIRRVVRSRP